MKTIAATVVFYTLIITIFFFASIASAKGKQSIELMIGQMIMVGFRGTGELPLTPDLQFLLKDISLGRVGGVILFEPDYLTKSLRNIQTTTQVSNLTKLLQKQSPIPLFVAIDQEGGRVQRILPKHGAPYTPSALYMGKQPEQSTYASGQLLGNYLAGLGINVNFAPVVDIEINKNSPAIGAIERSFSSNVAQVINHAKAFSDGLNSSGLIFCLKHFPGHGSAITDSHDGFTDITLTWNPVELEPYKQLLANNIPGMVMVGHLYNKNFDQILPSSLSFNTISILRNDIGWNGVIITDDLQMKSISDNFDYEQTILLAINAGVDILLFGNNLEHDPALSSKIYELLVTLVKNGKISEKRICQSYNRIMRLKKKLVYLAQ
jgi:beta-N-acetylhexosaminidase